jgi:flagellar basal-body rod protein FlgF
MKPVYILTSNLVGQRQKMTLAADNVANLTTPGHKGLDIDFRELVASKKSTEVGSFNINRGTRYDLSNGAFEKTDNPLDLSLQGENTFFGILVNDQVQYTRNGHFQLDSGGNIVDDRGNPLVDLNGGTITVPDGTTTIQITGDGTVSGDEGPIAAIGLFEFDNPQSLLRAGGSYITQGEEPIPSIEAQVLQGFLEASNVSPVEETIRMTQLSRAYQSALKTVQGIEELEQRAVRELARMP